MVPRGNSTLELGANPRRALSISQFYIQQFAELTT